MMSSIGATFGVSMLVVRMPAMRKRRTALKLLIELLAVAVVMTVAAVSIYFGFRSPPIHDKLRPGGRNVDISKSGDAQVEASVAADPVYPRRLLAGSMDGHVDARVYASMDEGRTWTSEQAPPAQRAPCGLSHPSVAIGGRDLQVYASLVSDTCQPADPRLVVATRRGFSGTWRVRRVGISHGYVFDQRPAVAVDGGGVAYVVWPRLVGEFSSRQVVLLSRSDDGGATWSPPVRVGRYRGVYGLDLAAGASGELYLAVSDGRGGRIVVLRSTDGGSTWNAQRIVARLRQPYVVGCGAGASQVDAQPQRCVSNIARIALSLHRVALAWGDATPTGTHAVFSATSDRALREPFRPRRIAADEPPSADRFLPTIAYDRRAADLWVCYYDTYGDPTRKHAWYTCTLSRDGGRTWARPVHAASAKSSEAETGSDPNGYGDVEGLVAYAGAAHPVWTDNRNSLKTSEEIYTAAIPAKRLRR
jgi:hypothetical protein